MSDEHTDEWFEGYAAFNNDTSTNPYVDIDRRDSWDDGWYAAYLDWRELMGAN